MVLDMMELTHHTLQQGSVLLILMALIILNTGKIVGLGRNQYGELGDNSTTSFH